MFQVLYWRLNVYLLVCHVPFIANGAVYKILLTYPLVHWPQVLTAKGRHGINWQLLQSLLYFHQILFLIRQKVCQNWMLLRLQSYWPKTRLWLPPSPSLRQAHDRCRPLYFLETWLRNEIINWVILRMRFLSFCCVIDIFRVSHYLKRWSNNRLGIFVRNLLV